MPRPNVNWRLRQQKGYERARRQPQPEAVATPATEQPEAVPLEEMLELQLRLQQQQAQQQAIPTLQPQQGAQFFPLPFPAGGEALQTGMAPLLQLQQIQLVQFLPHANPPANNTDLHHIAPMNNTCPDCGAKYFKEEQNTRNKYTKCCREGTVTLPQIQPPRAALMSLFLGDTQETQRESKDFPSKFRQYNATMAMASWTANTPQLHSRGTPVITIHGSAYHRTEPTTPPTGISTKAPLRSSKTNFLHAQEYKNIGNILQQQLQQATAANEPIPTFDMIITSRADEDHRYHSPAAAEIAAIYSIKDGAAPDPNDRIIHIQRYDGYLIDIKATNPTADPLTYPLLFPFGEHDWGTAITKLPAVHTQIPADQPERRQTRVTASQFYTYRIQV
eukprot:gene21396-biopygen17172